MKQASKQALERYLWNDIHHNNNHNYHITAPSRSATMMYNSQPFNYLIPVLDNIAAAEFDEENTQHCSAFRINVITLFNSQSPLSVLRRLPGGSPQTLAVWGPAAPRKRHDLSRCRPVHLPLLLCSARQPLANPVSDFLF